MLGKNILQYCWTLEIRSANNEETSKFPLSLIVFTVEQA